MQRRDGRIKLCLVRVRVLMGCVCARVCVSLFFVLLCELQQRNRHLYDIVESTTQSRYFFPSSYFASAAARDSHARLHRLRLFFCSPLPLYTHWPGPPYTTTPTKSPSMHTHAPQTLIASRVFPRPLIHTPHGRPSVPPKKTVFTPPESESPGSPSSSSAAPPPHRGAGRRQPRRGRR